MSGSFARIGRGLGALVLVIGLATLAGAQEPQPPARGIEEITVTARQKAETLQDVPVTVAAFTEADLDRYNVQTLPEAAKLVPNFQIVHGGSGNGSNLYLRGVGSSSISAAFDQSVAINIDGVVGNIGRLIHNAYLDMGQLEILKGPQSLYFGKSATAGVISITTKDPGDEFETEVMAAYEFEHEQKYTELILSGPVTETFGARFAAGWSEADELFENLSPFASKHWRGERSGNARLTLVWDPVETLRARFKLEYSDYENDGANGRVENLCVEGVKQPTNPNFGPPLTNVRDDCRQNTTFAIDDLNPILATNLPYGGDDGEPFLEQSTWLTSLRLDWDLQPSLTLTSVTGYIDMDHRDLDIYCYCDPVAFPGPGSNPLGSPGGVYGGLHRNIYKSFSQEFRLTSDFDGPLNFMLGLYFQDVEQQFRAYQYALNAAVAVGVDPVTGNGYDYNKNHFLKTDVFSTFVAGYWNITESLELTAGVRFTDEDKDGKITVPYMHQTLAGIGFLSSGSKITDLDFEDDNWSPEAALNWYVNDDVSVFAAYKEGFKSGGVDNSALPNNTLNPSFPGFPGPLIYDSEEAKGGEIGFKANLLDSSLRLNATAFHYVYEDLQVQQFDSSIIQFSTFNASELTTRGVEADFLWLTPVEGLQLRGSVALTDAEYTDRFIQVDGQDLDGEDRERSADLAWYLGASYEMPLFGSWSLGLDADVRFNDGYPLEGRVGAIEQGDFWLYDASIRIFSEDRNWELALIGKNLLDEIYGYGSGADRPGAIPSVAGGPLDKLIITSLGRQITLQARFRY